MFCRFWGIIFSFLLIFHVLGLYGNGKVQGLTKLTYAEYYAIEQVKSFRSEILYSLPKERKTLLIAVILDGTNIRSIRTMQKNLIYLSQYPYDFAAIFYSGRPEMLQSLCHPHQFNPQMVHCKRALISYSFPNATIPKPFFYTELTPYLRQYYKVLVIDEDILLSEVNFTEYLHLWNCAFSPSFPPLIVQGLVYGKRVYYDHLNADVWKNHSNVSLREVIATGIDLVEMQFPAFDSLFFLWYIQYILPWTLEEYAKGQSSWGIDYFWCGAAKVFAESFYNVNVNEVVVHDSSNEADKTFNYTPCALLLGSSRFHHLDGRTMTFKHHMAVIVREVEGFERIGYWNHLFPTWSTEKLNPFLSNRYRKVTKLPSLCTY